MRSACCLAMSECGWRQAGWASSLHARRGSELHAGSSQPLGSLRALWVYAEVPSGSMLRSPVGLC